MLGSALSPSRGLKLFGREIIFEEFQPMWSRYGTWTSHTDRRTDRLTDRRTDNIRSQYRACTTVHRAVKTLYTC